MYDKKFNKKLLKELLHHTDIPNLPVLICCMRGAIYPAPMTIFHPYQMVLGEKCPLQRPLLFSFLRS